ncbi:hypothetical protein JXA88_08445 [Candidatus Fermentibacteria bacterium]|nr:hypothetical protein [Candidatus Fermentibacteria bacterium]
MREEHASVQSPKRFRGRMALYGAVLLICGMIIGAGVMASVLWERFQHSVRDPKGMPERIAEDMRQGLQLSDAQADQIKAIMERHRDEFDEIRSEMEPRIQAHMDQVDAEIREVLTPEQRSEWERRFARERRRWSRTSGQWKGPPGPPGEGGHRPPPPGPFPDEGDE